MTKLLGNILCFLGFHGPEWFGNRGDEDRALRTAGFERTCMHCGAVWHGRQVETRYMRTIGDWIRVK